MKNSLFFCASLLLGLSLAIGFQFTKQTITHHIVHKLSQTNFSSATPPSQSLRGIILAFTGDVGWESRTATQSVQLTTIVPIQQGESLETKDTGTIRVQFPDIGIIALSPDTKIDFVQTLPVNLVLQQEQGTAIYTRIGTKTPLSIRALDLLTNIDGGVSRIQVDTGQNLVTITVMSGQVTAAYNDTNYVSQVVTITQGQQFIFDDNAKIYTIE